jgi:protein-tyrosine phosphatase
MILVAKLNLKNVFDLRTAAEKNPMPDELPVGVNNIWLDVLADVPASGPANLNALLTDPKNANTELGD